MKNRISLILISTCIFNYACTVDNPVAENPDELITTLKLEFTPQGGGDVILFQFHDIDGDGGDLPLINVGVLTAQTMYHASVTLLNEADIPVQDITEEIQEEAEAHQFFFVIDGIQIAHAYIDADDNGSPIGISNDFTTGPAGTGTLKVILRHQPDKSAPGVNQGDIANAGGDTDIEVEFPVTIE